MQKPKNMKDSKLWKNERRKRKIRIYKFYDSGVSFDEFYNPKVIK